MSHSAECGATVVPAYCARLPKHGVPQGSILSFLCQTLYMENIIKCYLQIMLKNIYQL